MRTAIPAIEKFETGYMPEPNTGCWIWIRSLQSDGYGAIWLSGRKKLSAHRYSYTLHKGPIPLGMLVCHKCDNPWCVNPDHLFLGTYMDNMKDKIAKGRLIPPWRSDNCNWTTLKIDKVLEIKRLSKQGKKDVQIAKLVGLTRRQVWNITSGRTWKHV